jgi:hypothetical protein
MSNLQAQRSWLIRLGTPEWLLWDKKWWHEKNEHRHPNLPIAKFTRTAKNGNDQYILYGHLVHSSRYGMLYQAKSGNPGLKMTISRHFLVPGTAAFITNHFFVVTYISTWVIFPPFFEKVVFISDHFSHLWTRWSCLYKVFWKQWSWK